MGKKGILIVAVGHSGYGRMASNLALSLLYSKNTLPIQLVCTETAIVDLTPQHLALFTTITKITKDYYGINGVYEYGYLKCCLDLLTVFEETIYIDADTLLLGNFNFNDYVLEGDLCIQSNVQNNNTNINLASFNGFDWISKGDMDLFLADFPIKYGEYVFTQTSFIAFKTNETTNEFFKTLRECFTWFSTEIEYKNIAGALLKRKRFHTKWYGYAVPDELCYTTAIMVSGLIPKLEHITIFAIWDKSIEIYAKRFHIVSFACGTNTLRPSGERMYNTLVQKIGINTGVKTFRWMNKKNFNVTDKIRENGINQQGRR